MMQSFMMITVNKYVRKTKFYYFNHKNKVFEERENATAHVNLHVALINVSLVLRHILEIPVYFKQL